MTISKADLEQYHIDPNNPTRAQIERWIGTNTGDFSSVEDFSADIGENKIIPWAKGEESELRYLDCVSEED